METFNNEVATANFREHPGTTVLVQLLSDTTTNPPPAMLHSSAVKLYEEALCVGIDKAPSPQSVVYSWIDEHALNVSLSAYSEDEKNVLTGTLKNLAAQYSHDNSYITPAHIYAWKHTATVSLADHSRKVRHTPSTVAVDVDGVLYDVDTVMWRWLTNRGYAPPEHEIRSYNMDDNWGIPRSVLDAEFVEAVNSGFMFRYGQAYGEGVTAVRHLYREGHRIVVLTARDFPEQEHKCRQATVQWLRDKGIPFDELVLSSDKEQYSFDILVDDAPANITKVVASGKSGVLLQRPWNREGNEGHTRSTWVDVVRLLS